MSAAIGVNSNNQMFIKVSVKKNIPINYITKLSKKINRYVSVVSDDNETFIFIYIKKGCIADIKDIESIICMANCIYVLAKELYNLEQRMENVNDDLNKSLKTAIIEHWHDETTQSGTQSDEKDKDI